MKNVTNQSKTNQKLSRNQLKPSQTIENRLKS